LKCASLAAHLRLTTHEIAHFANDTDYSITNDGWLNALPVSGNPAPPVAAALLRSS
jgi:hypothetical protein